jgi:acyl-coenzyme A thioesterase PaaI-like protein
MRPELERRLGTRQFHGGPIAALIDIAGDLTIGVLVGGDVPTINFRTDYLRGQRSARLSRPQLASDAGKTVVRHRSCRRRKTARPRNICEHRGLMSLIGP